MAHKRLRRICITNNKGGTMKTASLLGLAEALAFAGYNVLVVDMDPQGNASRRLATPYDEENPTPTVSEAIKESQPGIARAAFAPCGWEVDFAKRITVLPARKELENRISEAAVPGAVRRLSVALEGVDDEFDFILFDCQPSLGHLTQMAMAASEGVLVMSAPEYDDIEGAVRVQQFVAEQAVNMYNPELEFWGVVPTRVRDNLGAHQYQLSTFDEVFGADNVWSTQLPERTAIKDANDAAVPLRSFRSGMYMAGLFDELAAAVRKRVGL